MGLLQRRSAALGETDVLEVALLELNEGLDHVLKRDVLWNARGLKKIHLFYTTEFLVDKGDAAPEILRADGRLRGDIRTNGRAMLTSHRTSFLPRRCRPG